MTVKEFWVLSKSELFYGLSESDSKNLLSNFSVIIKNYKRDNCISVQGDPYTVFPMGLQVAF